MDASTTPLAGALGADLDYAILGGSDAYPKYFNLLTRVLNLLTKCQEMRHRAREGAGQGETFEASFIEDAMRRLIYTTGVLRTKFGYTDDHIGGGLLQVDLSDSGFPNHFGIKSLVVDYAARVEELARIPSSDRLKEKILDQLITEHADPETLLAALCRRTYLEQLDTKKLFLPYTSGPLTQWTQGGGTKKGRGYVAGWGCYDPAKNCPYLHIMFFEQDASETPLEEKGENFQDLVRVLQTEGSRAPDQLNVLANMIDASLDPIHPKILKRMRIGPLYAPLLLQGRPTEELTDVEKVFGELFNSSSREDDFALFLTEEVITSAGQKQSRNVFKSIMREVFYVPRTDPDASQAGATQVERSVLMPHRLLQTITAEEAARLPRFPQRVKYGYDGKDNIHEVG